MGLVVILLVIAVAIVGISVVTEARRDAPPHRTVSRSVLRVARRHAEETGLVVDVFWAVAYRFTEAHVERVSGVEPRRFGRRTVLFVRQRTARWRPAFVPLAPGEHEVLLTSEGRGGTEETSVRLEVPTTGHLLLTCWPAKRRIVTPARPATVWASQRLPS